MEGGNPQNSAPSFVSPTNITLAENDDNSGYIFYTARAISARSDSSGTRQAITYIIDENNTDIRIINLLNIHPTEGTLSILADKSLPTYDDLVTTNNEYHITLTAKDRQATGEMRLTLNITDVFNLTVAATTKALQFQWAEVVDNNDAPATYYQLLQDINGDGDYILISQKNALTKITQTQFTLDVALHLTALKPATRYQLKAYLQPDPAFSATLIKTSVPLALANALSFPEDIIGMIAYLKASNTGKDDWFGWSVALSADGSTLAVGAAGESSANGGPVDGCIHPTGEEVNCQRWSGAVYVFQRQQDNSWVEEAYLKAENAGFVDTFGHSIALSADGSTLAVGASNKDSGNGGPADDCAVPPNQQRNCQEDSGAAYVFQRQGDNSWVQQGYLKASNAGSGDGFGLSVALISDGSIIVVGALNEGSAANGGPVDDCAKWPDEQRNCQAGSGAAYVFQRQGDNSWVQQAYLKAANAGSFDRFGRSVVLSADGSTLAVGTSGDSSAIGGPVDDCTKPFGDQGNCQRYSGAVYVY